MTFLCHINDIENNASKGFAIDDLRLFAVKKDNQLFIYKNSCPHLGIELEWNDDDFLDSESTLIQCSTHGALFLIPTGECISGPCLGKALQAIAFTEQDDGSIHIHDAHC